MFSGDEMQSLYALVDSVLAMFPELPDQVRSRLRDELVVALTSRDRALNEIIQNVAGIVAQHHQVMRQTIEDNLYPSEPLHTKSAQLQKQQ